MIQALSDGVGIFEPVNQSKSTATNAPNQRKADAVDLSASHDVFGAVDNFFNQGDPSHLSSADNLSPAEKEQFVKIVGTLLQNGYVGYEDLVVNNKVERHDILMQTADDRLRKARLYHDPKTQK